MFNKEVKRDAVVQSTTSNIISRGTILEGNIKTTGNLRIEGRVIGNLITKSKASLAQSSYVDGNILAKNAEVAGEVRGKVEVSEMQDPPRGRIGFRQRGRRTSTGQQ